MKTGKKVVFAVPGSKVFISKYYRNKPNSFLNISLTGRYCELLCRHCRAILLEDMVDINLFNSPSDRTENRLLKILKKFGIETVKGMLLSGGFDKNGILPLDDRIINEIREVKSQTKNQIKIFMHLGFMEKDTADALYDCGIDGVLVNVISDQDAIEKTYNLKNHNPDSFYKNIKVLKDAGLKVAPHIIIGLNDGKISGEFNSIEQLSSSGVDAIVFAIVKKISKHFDFINPDINVNEIIELFDYTKKLVPDMPISLGCARPSGFNTEKLEIELLKRGIEVISFPSDAAIEFAEKNNFKFSFLEQCCTDLEYGYI